MRLAVLHYHFRPGGIRRVIELATPWLVRSKSLRITAVTLVAGEADDQEWNEAFRNLLASVPVDFVIDPAFGYLAEQPHGDRRRRKTLRALLGRMLADDRETVVWAHNLGIARNLIMAEELNRACARHRIRLIAHHHDWWFENRWQRWPEFRRSGVRGLTDVARLTIFAGPSVRHASVNRADTAVLRRHLGRAASWLPNPADDLRPRCRAALAHAREWLGDQFNGNLAPVWICPCRLLRRKNLAEAVLLTRWLRSEAWLVTTGGPSSADEQTYARRLSNAAATQGWRLRLGILDPPRNGVPGVKELIALSETVLLTSIQEGFGLSYLEAAAARRPLIARALPNIMPDLHRFGFEFPHAYSSIRIEPRLFCWDDERERQRQLFQAWRSRLPHACRALAGQPALLAAAGPQPVAFGRLTLTAQLEVLSHDRESSWRLCLPLNPFLADWQKRARQRRLQCTPPPAGGWKQLNGRAYAARFVRMLRRPNTAGVEPAAARAVQDDFIRAKLAADQLYPLLWNLDS